MVSYRQVSAVLALSVSFGIGVACGSSDSDTPTNRDPFANWTRVPDKADGGHSDDQPPVLKGGLDGGKTVCSATTSKAEKAMVDIIFVIDNSGSMTEETIQI